ncbi:MAG: peptidoglycan-binding protein [Leptolyngbyaceae cyanobacterium SM2_5_2]|nr:peptidoglycan-binding protein [Leptolyngbyaceae cyanobacterium SM2_5_2]
MTLNQLHGGPMAQVGLPMPLLQPGSQGAAVSQLQTSLAQLGFYNDSIDGLYGSTTTQAVKVFQQAKVLPADGIAGPQTQQVLALATSPPKLVSRLVVLQPDSLTFTPLVVALPASPPSPWWLLVMPLIPLIGGGLTYLQHQHQTKRLSKLSNQTCSPRQHR